MEDYSKYKKEDLVEIMDYLDKEITSLDGVAIRLCELLSCPVTLLNQDFRTEEERILRHATCCSQLYNWIKKEATKN